MNTVTVEILITDYDWNETSRPALTISSDFKFANLYVGGTKAMMDLPCVEIIASDEEELRLLLEGYRDIFEAALQVLKEKKNDSGG